MPLKTRGRSGRLGSSDMMRFEVLTAKKNGRLHGDQKPDKTLILL
jgi:hypothetical protein